MPLARACAFMYMYAVYAYIHAYVNMCMYDVCNSAHAHTHVQCIQWQGSLLWGWVAQQPALYNPPHRDSSPFIKLTRLLCGILFYLFGFVEIKPKKYMLYPHLARNKTSIIAPLSRKSIYSCLHMHVYAYINICIYVLLHCHEAQKVYTVCC